MTSSSSNESYNSFCLINKRYLFSNSSFFIECNKIFLIFIFFFDINIVLLFILDFSFSGTFKSIWGISSLYKFILTLKFLNKFCWLFFSNLFWSKLLGMKLFLLALVSSFDLGSSIFAFSFFTSGLGLFFKRLLLKVTFAVVFIFLKILLCFKTVFKLGYSVNLLFSFLWKFIS